MKTLRVILNCIIFVILTLLISCEKPENEPEFEPLTPQIHLSVSSMDFGEVLIGKDSTQSFGISNTGDTLLTVESVSFQDTIFQIVSPDFPREIASEGSITVTVGFFPKEEKAYSDNLVVTSDDPDESEVEIFLRGAGLKPEFEPHSLEWSQTFGGSDYDGAYSVQQTADGGYVLAGWTDSYGYSPWLIKTNAMGAEQWSQTFSSGIEAYSVQQTTDGGYILAGWTCDSYEISRDDALLIKTDAEGTEQWSQTFGGLEDDYVNSVQQTTDGGYILAGWTASFGVSGEAWLIKTDAIGTEEWSQTFSGAEVNSVQQTTDGGYILAGNGSGVLLIKTDVAGVEQWSQTFSGTEVHSVQQTTDGGYILAGWTWSSETAGGIENVLLIKTDAAGVEQWNQTFGGSDDANARSVQQTTDGGYILAGWTDSYYEEDGYSYRDVLLIKTDAAGIKQWDWTFGDFMNDDEAWSVQQATDGGYIIAGYTDFYESNDCDALLIKVRR